MSRAREIFMSVNSVNTRLGQGTASLGPVAAAGIGRLPRPQSLILAQPDAMHLHRIDDVCRLGTGHENRQGLLRFEEELAAQDLALAQEGIAPPIADGSAGAFQCGLSNQPVGLLNVDLP